MGDLNRGANSTFAAGDTVTAAKLHKLVDDATLKDGVVTTAKISDGAITAAKLAAGISVPAASIPLPENNVILGNASNLGAHLPVGSTLTKVGFLDVADGAIVEAKIGSGAVTAGKIPDAAITSAKLAPLSPSPAGTYGSSSVIPVVVVSATGQVTGVSTVAPVSVTNKVDLAQKAVLTSPGSTDSWAVASKPHLFQVWFECVSDSAGYSSGDRVPIESVFYKNGNDTWPAFSVKATASAVRVVAYGQNVLILHGSTGAVTDITASLSSWRLAGSAQL